MNLYTTHFRFHPLMHSGQNHSPVGVSESSMLMHSLWNDFAQDVLEQRMITLSLFSKPLCRQVGRQSGPLFASFLAAFFLPYKNKISRSSEEKKIVSKNLFYEITTRVLTMTLAINRLLSFDDREK